MKVLVACEYSGRVREAFRARGHDAWSCDLLPPEDSSNYHIQGDVLKELQPGRWDLMIAHPDCTRLTNAGVRWLHEPPKGKTFDDMWSGLYDGTEFYRALRDAPIPKKAIENPIMHKYARAMVRPGPRQVVQPWWFGDEAFIDMTPFIENGLDCIFTNPTEFVSDRDFIGPLRNMGNDSAVGRFYDDHTGRHFKCCRPRLNHPFLWSDDIELPEGLVVEYCWDRITNRKPIWRDHNPFGSRSDFLILARIIDKKDGYVWAGGE